MARRYFGTDGIRGRANAGLLDAATAMKVGQAAGRHFLRGTHKHRIIIGKDTRLSGYMMETALVAGFTSVGMDVVMTGPLPTPAIALLTREMRADLGVMISASHNPYHDNGIKLFGPDGFKLSDADEEAIERLMEGDIPLAQDRDVGRTRRIEDARGRYIHAIKQSLPHDIRFDSLKVVVDCAHGAAYEVAPTAIWELGAKVIAVGVSPNGLNINDGVGSTSLEAIKAREGFAEGDLADRGRDVQRRFDAIEAKVDDGVLRVEGVRRVSERAPGLGGGFTYCTLGEPIELAKLLSGKHLPETGALGAWLFHTATGATLHPPAANAPASPHASR